MTCVCRVLMRTTSQAWRKKKDENDIRKAVGWAHLFCLLEVAERALRDEFLGVLNL